MFVHGFANGPDCWLNFNSASEFPAAILEFLCKSGQKVSWRFVAEPLLGKVSKPFRFIPNGSGNAIEKIGLGQITSPPQLQ